MSRAPARSSTRTLSVSSSWSEAPGRPQREHRPNVVDHRAVRERATREVHGKGDVDALGAPGAALGHRGLEGNEREAPDQPRLLGERLGALADLRLRLVPLVVGALCVQILVVNVIPHGDHDLHAAILVATYGALAVALIANRGVPGVPVIALGGLANLAAIIANGGVMPASASALRTAGLTADPAGYTNSGLVAHAHLAFLGDIFALPASWPAANVFSVGDLLLALGAFVLLHGVCRSRLGRVLPARGLA
jgi:hypothetical protein